MLLLVVSVLRFSLSSFSLWVWLLCDSGSVDDGCCELCVFVIFLFLLGVCCLLSFCMCVVFLCVFGWWVSVFLGFGLRVLCVVLDMCVCVLFFWFPFF